MIVVHNITVSTQSRDSLSLDWSYGASPEDLSVYVIEVLRSQSEIGPYNSVSKKINASYTDTFSDTSVNLFSKNREYFYRIKVTNTSDNATMEYGSTDPKEVMAGVNPKGVTLEAPPDFIAIEAIRRHDMLLKNFVGRRALIMKRRTTGTRCTNCWDHIKRRRQQSNCLSCYDTGITGGYYSPQETFVGKAPEKRVVALTPLMEIQPSDLVMYISSRPRIFPRDLVIYDNRRLRVIGVQMTEKLGASIRQIVSLRELSKDQVEYRIDLTAWDKNPATASASLQHTVATDINSYYAQVESRGKNK